MVGGVVKSITLTTVPTERISLMKCSNHIKN